MASAATGSAKEQYEAAVALLGWAAALDYLSLFEAPPLPERPAPIAAPAPKTAP